MPNDYYNHGGYPAPGSAGASASARAEFEAIMAGFALLPPLAGNGLKLLRVNAGGTALESTNSIDGVAIGAATPSTGAFTTLNASGAVVLGSTLSVTGAVVLGSTLSVTGAATFSNNLTVNGSTSLGDAASDTLSVSGSVIRNATGNWLIPAPSSGVPLHINTDPLSTSQTWGDGTVTGRLTFTGSQVNFGAQSNHGLRLQTNGTSRLEITSAGRVDVNTPASAVNTVVIAPPFNNAVTSLVIGDTTNARTHLNAGGLIMSVGQQFIASSVELHTANATGFQIGTSVASPINFWTNSVARGTVGSAGNWTLSVPTSGVTLALTGIAGNNHFTWSDGTRTGGLQTAGGSVYVGATTNHALELFSNNTTRVTLGASGNVVVGAPSAGDTIQAAAVAGGAYLIGSSALAGSTGYVYIRNTSNTSSSSAAVLLEVAGTSAGDPYQRFTVAGVADFAIGLDNDDGDSLVICAAATVGSSGRRIRIPITGAISLEAGAYTPTSSQAFSATPTFNAQLSNYFEMGAMTANVTSVTITNPVGGQTITIRFKQDGTGGRTVASPSGAKISGSVSATANAASLLTLTYSTADSRWEGAWTQTPA